MKKNNLKIYVASSWRNNEQPKIVFYLRKFGFEVYDFKNPSEGDNGFGWSKIGQKNEWSALSFINYVLPHPIAQNAFDLDMNALKNCDICILALECGKSAHLELGYAVGCGKKTIVYMPSLGEPELMYKMCDKILTTIAEVVNECTAIQNLQWEAEENELRWSERNF